MSCPNVSRDEDGTVIKMLHWDDFDELDLHLKCTNRQIILAGAEEVKEGELKRENNHSPI